MSDFGRLLVKLASAHDEIGPYNLEKHLDGLISSKGGLGNSTPKNQFIELILKIVAKEFDITVVQLRRGLGEAAFPLNITYAYIKNNTTLTWDEIAGYFNRKTHGGVCRRGLSITQLNPNSKVDKANYDKWLEIERKLNSKIPQKIKENGSRKR